jgi:hypothetical protein
MKHNPKFVIFLLMFIGLFAVVISLFVAINMYSSFGHNTSDKIVWVCLGVLIAFGAFIFPYVAITLYHLNSNISSIVVSLISIICFLFATQAHFGFMLVSQGEKNDAKARESFGYQVLSESLVEVEKKLNKGKPIISLSQKEIEGILNTSIKNSVGSNAGSLSSRTNNCDPNNFSWYSKNSGKILCQRYQREISNFELASEYEAAISNKKRILSEISQYSGSSFVGNHRLFVAYESMFGISSIQAQILYGTLLSVILELISFVCFALIGVISVKEKNKGGNIIKVFEESPEEKLRNRRIDNFKDIDEDEIS